MRKKAEYEIDFDIFRTQVWIRHTLNRFRIDLKTFAKQAVRHASALTEAQAWYYGEHKITPRMVKVIDQRLKGSAEIFDLPLFQLLTTDQLDERSVHRILSPYYHRAPDGGLRRVLPPFNCVSLKIKYPWEHKRVFFNELVYRADIHAFTLLLGMFWLSVSQRATLTNTESMKALWRILPAIEHLGWIWPMRSVLRKYLQDLNERAQCDGLTFEIDVGTLNTLLHCWRRRPISFLDSWRVLPWDSGDLDPVVVYDHRSRRPVEGEFQVISGSSELVDRYFSRLYASDLMPHSMSRREWRAYVSGQKLTADA
jgi:hypothetical protein